MPTTPSLRLALRAIDGQGDAVRALSPGPDLLDERAERFGIAIGASSGLLSQRAKLAELRVV